MNLWDKIDSSNLWLLYDKFLFMYRLAAFLPYTRIKTGETVSFVEAKPNVYNVGNIIVIYIVTFSTQGLRFSVTDSSDPIGYASILIQYTCLSIVVAISMVIFLFNHSKFLEAQKLIIHIDEELKELKFVISFRNWFLYHALGMFALLTPLFMGVVAKKPLCMLILDGVCYGYPINVRCIMLSTILMHFIFLHERFKLLNRFLEQLDTEDSLTEKKYRKMLDICNEKSPEHILQKVTEIHQNLVLCSKLLNDTFSIILLLNMLTNFAQFVFGIFYNIMGGSKVVTLTELNVIIFVYTSQMSIIFVTCHLLKLQSENSLALLGQLNIYYLNAKLAFMRNTLLLQGSHNKVNLTLAGLFPLDMGIFLKQIAFGNNVVLLLVQYQQKN